MFNNILFVCVGNICRSPVAEGLLRHHFKQNQRYHQVASCGLSALVGEPPADYSLEIMRAKGIDISAYRAKQISKDMVVNADLILTMENDQIKAVQSRYPFAVGKVHLLGKWTNEAIPDPYKKGKVAFETMCCQVEHNLQYWIDKFWKVSN